MCTFFTFPYFCHIKIVDASRQSEQHPPATLTALRCSTVYRGHIY